MRDLPATAWQRTLSAYSIHDLITDYMKFCQVKFTPGVFQEKKSLFRRLFRSLDPHLPAESVTPRMALDYLSGQVEKRSGYAANKDRKNLVACWNWGVKYQGLSGRNPFLVDRFPENRQARYMPPEEDFWRVFEVARGQDKTMLLAYLHLAARRSELFRLRWDDVDFFGWKVRLLTRKRKDGSWGADWLPMTDDLCRALQAHRDFVGGEYVFPDPQTGGPYRYRIHVMGKLCQRAGVRPFGHHAIRHLAGSILANAGVPMKTIQGILRHRALSTTERYLHRLGDMREALKLLQRPKPDGDLDGF